MREPLQWSFPIGRLFGAAVRVHVTLPVVLLGLYLKALHDNSKLPVPAEGISTAALGVLGLLFVSILLHEFGHVFAARAVGGDCDEVVLWPLGGLALCDLPHSPRAHFLTALAGPMVTFAICLLSAAALVGQQMWPPFNPFGSLWYPKLVPWTGEPAGEPTWYLLLAARLFAVNWLLLLFNLLPAYPLDFGRMLHATLWSRGDERAAAGTTGYVGIVCMLLLVIVSIAVNELLLFALALFIYVNCRQLLVQAAEGADDTAYGSDFVSGLEREAGPKSRPPRPNFVQRWMQRRAARRALREQHAREYEESRMDQLLEKVQRGGLQSLTDEERRFLSRVSARYRNSG